MAHRPTITALILAAVIMTACGPGQVFGPTPDPCSPEIVLAYLEDLDKIAVRFDDANNLANSTSRASLSPQIASLQEVRRDAQELDAPVCAKPTQEKLVTYMDAVIDTYIAFLDSDVSDATMKTKVQTATNALVDYQRSIDDLTERVQQTP